MSHRRRIMAAITCGVVLAAAGMATPAAAATRIASGAPLQEAIDTANEGDVLLLERGPHRGPVVIDQSITLRGESGARLVGSGTGSVVTVEAADVVIENLHVSRSGRSFANDDAGVLVLGDDSRIENLHLERNLHGVYVRGADNVRIQGNRVIGLAATEDEPVGNGDSHDDGHHDDVHHAPPGTQALMGNGIHLWNTSGARVVDNHVHHVRDGIYVSHTRDAAFRDNRIHDSRYGIHYMYSSDNVIEANELWRNVAGPALMFSRNLQVVGNTFRDHSGFRAYGLLLQDVEQSQIHDNDIRGNRVGMRMQNSSANDFRRNHIFGNLAGLTINSSSRDNTFARNRLGLNMRQLELTGPAPETQWAVDGVGNTWHGGMTLDLTGDGISQWPHHEVDLMAERRERFPHVQLLTGSPGVQVVEWALKRAPVPGMRYITDPHPLTPGGRR